MRKHWLIAATILAASGLTFALVLRFGPKPASPGSDAQSEPSQEVPISLADRDRLCTEALAHQESGQYAEAVALYDQALAVERSLLGSCHEDIVATLQKKAELQALLEDFEHARHSAQEALDIQDKLAGVKLWQRDRARHVLQRVEDIAGMDGPRRLEHREAASLRDRLLTLYLQGKYRDGLKVAEQERTLTEQALGKGHIEAATSLNNLGVLHLSLGDYARAEPCYRQALKIFRKELGESHPDYVTIYNNLAVLHGLKGDYEAALPLYQRALELRRGVVGEKHPDYVRSVNNLAWLYKTLGDYASAQPLYLKALALHESGVRYGHASSHILEIYRQVDLRRPPTRAQMQTDQALIVGNLAVCYHEMGDYTRAEPLYRKALALNVATVGEQSAVYARNLNNLATLYQLMGDFAQAEDLYKKSVSLRKEALGDKHPDYAASLHNLARFYHLIEDYDRAEPLYLQALAIRKQKLGEKHPYYAQTLDKLAWLYHVKGDYTRAAPLYTQALEARKAALGENHRYDATIVTNQALLYHAMGKLDRAEELFRKSLEWTKKQVGEQHPEYARTLHHLAMLQLARKRHDDAERMGRQPVEISRGFLERCAGVQSERQQLAMMQTSRFYLDGYLTIAASEDARAAPEKAYSAVLAWKGAVLARQRHLRLQRNHPELAATFARLNRVSSRLAGLALADPNPKKQEATRRQIEELTQEKERLESDLAGRSAAFRQEQQAARLTLSDLQALLAPGTVLIDFLEYAHRSPPANGTGVWQVQRRLAAFILRPHSVVRLDLGPAQEIASAIDRWRAVYGAGKVPPAGMVDPASDLRERLWEPLEKQLQGVKVVLLSPDGPLHGVPFSALPGARPGTYLVHTYAFATIPVPQLLRGPPEAAQGPPSLLLVGGIDFGASAQDVPTRTSGLPDLPRFKALPGTEREIDDLAAGFRQAFPDGALPKVLSAEAATKPTFLTEAAAHRFVHLATHGFFADAREKSAHAVATRDGLLRADSTLRAEAAGRHPGLLSGVVFAGVNRSDRPEETILTALEASTLDLAPVELVVLSACETGRGQVAGGEGVLGLQRAFQLAGARSVVASLWSVPDEETRQLMRAFYRNLWVRGLPRLEALRQAQLAALSDSSGKPKALAADDRGGLKRPGRDVDRRHPYFWAAFVLSGDWR